MIYVYGLFKPSMVLELGLNRLKEEGFSDERLLVATLEPVKPGRQKLLDAMYGTDGLSLADGVAISAAMGMVLGTIYGSLVYIGPVALGLMGMAGGGVLGFFLDRRINRDKRAKYVTPAGEIIVTVRCINEDEAARAEAVIRGAPGSSPGEGSCARCKLNTQKKLSGLIT